MAVTLQQYLKDLRAGKHQFENVFQSVSRMIQEDHKKVEKVLVNGKTIYDFKVFREGPKPVVGAYELINGFVSYVKDAAEGGSSREMAFVLVGEPGNGKTFFVEKVMELYRAFLSKEKNSSNVPDITRTYKDRLCLTKCDHNNMIKSRAKVAKF